MAIDKARVHAELDELVKLERGWNGYPRESPPIKECEIHAARKFVDSLPDDLQLQPRAVPLMGGRVSLDFDSLDELSVEFDPGNNEVNVFLFDSAKMGSPRILEVLRLYEQIRMNERNVVPHD